jgi:class 3 adenylate cyclase
VRNISVATRLASVVVVVALVSLVVTSLVGLEQGGSLAEDEIRDQLAAVGAARADEAERYMASLERAVAGQSLTPRAALAIDIFAQRIAVLDAEPASLDDQRLVETFYRDVVTPELTGARGRPVSTSELVPLSPAAITLQANYVVPNAEGLPVEPAEWAAIHDPLDDAFQEFAQRAGFDDFYLIEPQDYVIVYSTAKDIDFATSLRTGPHSGSQLAGLIDDLADDPTPGEIALRDFAPYTPAGDRLGGFVGSPVFLDGELAGYVAGRFAPAELTAIMTNDERWGSLGDSGETYVVAVDSRMRSDAREFLQDRPAFFEQVEAAGTANADEIRSMQLFDTTVIFQEIDDQRVRDTFGRAASLSEANNYLGNQVLSYVQPLDIDGVDWAVFAEADLASIRIPIDDFARNLLIAIAVFIVVVTFLAVRWADRLLEPLRLISTRLRTIRDGGDMSQRAELPEGSAEEFVELSNDIDSMLAELQSRTERARRRADERRQVLRRLLPAPIAERAEAGDRDVVEHVAMATVVVVVIGGLGAFVSGGSPERARELLDRFVAEADDLAGERGLDRVQLSGDAYVAVCGATRPYLDHAARSATFALDMADMLRDLDIHAGLFVRAGIDVGPITVGLTGGSQLVHDTWGATVQGASDLARSASRNQVLVSDECRALLPASYRFELTPQHDASVLTGVTAESETAT